MLGEDEGPEKVPYTANSGPIHPPEPDSKPIEYAKLFINDQFVDILVRETNRYAAQWIASHQEYLQQKKFSRVHKWIKVGNVFREEIYAFLGLIINMGLIRKVTLESYWDSTNPSQHTPYFIDHFNRDRFLLILKFLHFANNEDYDEQNKIFKVQVVMEHFNRLFQRHYHPHQNISIDESMIGYKGKTPHLRQYMPNKHHARFGIKLWCLCDSTSAYTYTFECFKGAHDPQDRAAEGTTYALVMRLMTETGLLHRGHHLGLDNYFTSPRLFLDLFKDNTTATGTVRKNRKGLPLQVVKAKLRNKQVCERRKGNLLCVAYKDGSKQPILLSTQASGGFGQSINSKGVEKNKPKIVILYNKTMGGVDMSDARLYAYLSERRTMKWTKKVVFALIGRALLNAYIIYNENTSDTPKKTRKNFNISVVEDMVGDFRPPKVTRKRRSQAERQEGAETPQQFSAPDVEATAGPSRCKLRKLDVGKRRNCVNKHAARVRTSYECPSCNVGLCPACFAEYHSDK